MRECEVNLRYEIDLKQALKLFGGPETSWSLNGFWLGSAPFCLSRLLALVLGSLATGLECLGLQNLEAVGESYIQHHQD